MKARKLATSTDLIGTQSQLNLFQGVQERAIEQFGSVEKAERWLARPTSALGGAAPNALLGTEDGIAKVEALLGAIAHGLAT